MPSTSPLASPRATPLGFDRPPGPRGLALARAALDYHRHGLPAIERLIARYGDVIRVDLPGVRAFLVGHPEHIHRVLVTRRDAYEKIAGSPNVERFFGNAFQLTNGAYAQRMRRTLAHVFQPDRVAAAYGALVRRTTEAAIDRWRPGPRPGLTQELMDLALDITVELHLGAGTPDATRRAGRLFVDAMASLGNIMLPAWAHTPANRRYHAAVARLDAEVMARIHACRRTGAATPDLLATFVGLTGDDGAAMTDRQIRDELVTMMSAGYQSVGIAINQTLRLVAEHPEVDRRLAAELAETEPLVYAPKVVKEALRCCPPAGMIARRAVESDEIAGFAIPAGARVFLSAWAMHHDPRFFAEPRAFRPERWTPELERALPMCAYFPFGRGARSCIAGSLSSFIVQHVTTAVLRRYRLEAAARLPHDRSSWPGVLAAGGLQVSLAPR
jgi:cytochrome P450